MAKRPNIFTEFLFFVKECKSYWIVPLVVILLLMTVLVIASSSAMAPFIYTIF